MVYENLITPNEGLTWIYFSVSVDIPTNTLQLYVYNSKSKSNRILSNKGKTGVNLGVTPGKQVSLNAGYVTALKNTGYSFQVSSFLFTPNWFAKDSIELEQYRLKEPPKCSNKCTKACDNNNLCPLEAYISTDINVGDAFADDDLKDKFDADSLKKSSMFRTLDDFVVDNPKSANLICPSYVIKIFSGFISLYIILSSLCKYSMPIMILIYLFNNKSKYKFLKNYKYF